MFFFIFKIILILFFIFLFFIFLKRRREKNNKIIITTPIFYINRPPHIGTLVTVIYAQVYVRLLKLLSPNKDLLFSTGTDEHGTKIRHCAEESNLPIKDFCDKQSKLFEELFKKSGIEYDVFIRTTSEKHKETVHFIWNKLKSKGFIYLGFYSGFYSKSDEAFYNENEIYNGKAPTGSTVEFIKQKCYFFKLSIFKDKIKKFLKNNSDFTIPESKKNELIKYIEVELRDICVSRPGEWGIPVPNDKNQTIYVWFDALINYLTIIDYPNLKNINKYVHFLGKDISIFHGIVWIGMLLAIDFPLNKIKIQLAIHNWWIIDKEKMSKSKGNIIDPNIILDKYGIEAFTFYSLYNDLFNDDVEFIESDILSFYNKILVNKFSNLIYRVFKIIEKNEDLMKYYLSLKDIKNYSQYENLRKLLLSYTLDLKFRWYLQILLDKTLEINKFIEKEKIWENPQKIKDILIELLILKHFFLGIFNKDLNNFEIIFKKKVE